jgi:3-oxoacyl-[acyl-carrier-protein] synthase II
MRTPRRVVVTGIGVVTPLGSTYEAFKAALFEGESGVRYHKEWQEASYGLKTRLAATVNDFDCGEIPRVHRRSMSRVAMLAYRATCDAIAHAGLTLSDLQNENTSICYGSTIGGPSVLEEYFAEAEMVKSYIEAANSTTFLRMMPHTAAANLAIALGIPGPIHATCTACAASTQAIGYGYEAIRQGKVDRVIAGGSEEMHRGIPAIFEVLGATSIKFNDTPDASPRPFDEKRDGIVAGEGAGTLILEEYEAARARGAHIYGELVGYYTNNSSSHMTNPAVDSLVRCIEAALRAADLTPAEVEYVNAHATGTDVGDAAESHALMKVFGGRIKVSSTKGHLGHLMGAAGVVETVASLAMLEHKMLLPTRNLEHPSANCAAIDYVMRNEHVPELKYIVKNSFAFGGINATLILKGI